MSSKKHSSKKNHGKKFSFVKKRTPSSLSFETLESRLAMAVVINEFLAENNTGIRDFSGERHDWIELKNNGGATVDVSGWYLTDDALNLTKWQIPATPESQSLAPGEVLLVYASDKNGTFSNELHTNFKLSLEGEYLGLVQGNSTTIEHAFNPYPVQVADVSYGSGLDASLTVAETLINTGTAAKYRPFVAPNAAVDDEWHKPEYTAPAGQGWLNTTTGVGWNTDGGSEYTPYIPNPIPAFTQVSAYIRVPFNVTNKAALTSMLLEMRYDDGYVLWLNGREVKRVNINTSYKPGENWELNSRGNRSDATVISTPDVIDLTAWLDTIVEGQNVLAIYGANHTSQTGDFLIHPKLTAQRATGSNVDSYMVTSTPGMANGAGWDGVVGDTVFSHDRGFYDAAFALTISSPSAGATIRYTTDGTAPTLTNGITYSGPIAMNPASIPSGQRGVITIRAAAFLAGFVSTNVDTQSYVFLDKVLQQNGSGLPTSTTWGSPPDWAMDPAVVSAVGTTQMKSDMQAIPTMSLVMDWKDIFGDGTNHGIYTENTSWKDSSDERPTSLEYFTANGSEEFQIDAAVEVQGHSSTTRWNTDKLSLQVKFKVPYDKKLESSSLFGNSVIDGSGSANEFDNLVLDAQFNYTWLHSNVQQNGVAKYINDQAVSDLINLAGGDSPHGRWVHLYINGVYWGIYNAHERPDDSFAAEYYGGDEDDYYVVKAYDGRAEHPAQYLQVDGGLASEAAYGSFLTEVGHNLANNAEYQQVAALLDVDSFVDYMVVHYYAGNWDWGQDNWYATFNHVDEDGKWRFHAWDQEHAWPTDDNQPLGENNFDENYDPTTKNDAYGPTGIQHRLMLNEEYRLKFADRVQELMYNGGLLTPSVAASVFQARADEIDRAINGESARWGNNRVATAYDRDDWRANIAGLMTDFFPVRTANVLQHFNLVDEDGVKTDWIPTLDAPLFSQYGGEIASGFDLTLTKPAGSPGGAVIYYTLDGSDPRNASTNLASGSAIPYSGPIDLIAGTQVKARIFFNNSGTSNDWSPIVAKTFTLEDPLSLRIVEVMYNPPGEDDTEYFELLNTGTVAIELAGVQITEFSTGGFTFSAGTLNPGERIVVVKDDEFALAYPGITNIATGVFSGSLANEGELISLRGPLGELLQSFTYGDSNVAGWPTTTDGDGYSLEYIGPLTAGENPLDVSPADPFDNPANWRASLQLNGSPGTDGEANEPDSADFDGDGDIDGRDFLLWQRGYGKTITAEKEDGDADNNGDVDGGDLIVWQDQYGTTPPLSAIGTVTAEDSSTTPAIPYFWIDSLDTELAVFVADEPSDATNYVGEISRDDAFANLAAIAAKDDDFGDIAVSRNRNDASDELDAILFEDLV